MTETTSSWDFEKDKISRARNKGKIAKITPLDEIWLMSKFKYKSWDTLEKKRDIFEQVKIRWAEGDSAADIEKDFIKLEIPFKEKSIKKAHFAYSRSHEEATGVLDAEKYEPLTPLLQGIEKKQG